MKEQISIVVPVFNEEKTIEEVVNRIIKVKLPIEKEIILINDGSTDKTEEKIKKFCKKNKQIKLISNKKNMGKGYAIRVGFKNAFGSIIGIQDADMEYSPLDYKKLLEPILKKEVEVVYGSRFKKIRCKKTLFYYGNRFLLISSKKFELVLGSDFFSVSDTPTPFFISSIKTVFFLLYKFFAFLLF